MNSNIIKKCIEELNKENFRKDYVLGMLESLYETQDNKVLKLTSVNTPGVISQVSPIVNDESSMLIAEANAKMKNIDLSAIKTE